MSFVCLCSTPVEEHCPQLGADFYKEDMQIETNAYRDMLKRLNPAMLGQGVSIVVKEFEHDFGVYLEVVAEYEETNLQAQDLAFTLESEVPTHWDVPAIQSIADQLVRVMELRSGKKAPDWMRTRVVEVQQGRNLVGLIRKVRAGGIATANEILAYLTPEPV